MNNFKKIIKIILIGCLLCAIFFPEVYASNQEHGRGKKSAHNEAHDTHHAPPPLKYYLHWLILLAALGSAGAYLKRKFSAKHENKHKTHEAREEKNAHEEDEGAAHHGIHIVGEAKNRAFILCGMVIFLFFIEYSPALAQYHESVPVSLLKFAVKMALGICLTTFGILGMDEH